MANISASRRMDGQPLSVLVFTPLGQGGRGGIDRLMDELRRHFESSASEIRVRFITTRGSGQLALSPSFLFCAIMQLIWYSFVGKVDVLHINLSLKGSALRKLTIGMVARIVNIPYVVHLHGASFDKYWDQASAPVSRAINRFFEQSAAVIVLGSFWAKYVSQKCPVVSSLIFIVPNATHAASTAKPSRPGGAPLEILFLGELGARKGVPQLVSALGRICDHAPWHATLAGNGDIDATRDQIRVMGLERRITVPGWVDDKGVQNLLLNADILVLPSFDENLPMSLIEGCAHGLAIIATPVGATGDIIQQEQTGILVPPGDVDALASALRRLLSDAELRVRLGKNARALHADMLEIGKYVERLISIWRMAASSGDARRHVKRS